MNKEKELLIKAVDLCLIHNIETSNLYIQILNKEVELYQSHLELLTDTKPFFFQKKKAKRKRKRDRGVQEKNL